MLAVWLLSANLLLPTFCPLLSLLLFFASSRPECCLLALFLKTSSSFSLYNTTRAQIFSPLALPWFTCVHPSIYKLWFEMAFQSGRKKLYPTSELEKESPPSPGLWNGTCLRARIWCCPKSSAARGMDGRESETLEKWSRVKTCREGYTARESYLLVNKITTTTTTQKRSDLPGWACWFRRRPRLRRVGSWNTLTFTTRATPESCKIGDIGSDPCETGSYGMESVL